ncbi:MAG: hypothetical protein ACFFB0_11990 [Promethearchaeota archaeon]
MSVLTDEEIEKLKLTHPIKKIFRIFFLIIGSILTFVGILLFLYQFDFGIIIEDINISFLIDISIVVLGMIIASKFFIAPYYLHENSLTVKTIHNLREPVKTFIKFFSLNITRLIAAVLLIIAGLISLIIFGLDVGHEVKYGSAVVLGGPSWFYITGLPALGIGFSLLLYFFLSPFQGTFSQSENFYFFYEVRPGFPWLTEVPKKDIEAIRYQNNHLGPKLGWIMLLLPFIVMQLMTAIPLFAAERAGPEYVLSWVFIVISILESISLIFLVLLPQHYFEIATKTHLYEMWFSPFKIKNRLEQRKKISNFLGGEINRDYKKDSKNVISELKAPFSEISDTHFHLFDLIFGIFLITFAIMMLSQLILFGPLFWWISLIYGFILLVKAFNNDFSQAGGDFFSFNKEGKTFKFKRKFNYKFHHIFAYNVESIDIRKWFRKLDFFDLFGLGGMIIMLTIQQVEGWVLADTISLIYDNIISTFFMIILFIFVILYVCLPIDVVEFKTVSITYRTPVSLKQKHHNLLKRYVMSFKNSIRELLKDDMKWTFLLRITIISMLIIGSASYSIYNLLSYFI